MHNQLCTEFLLYLNHLDIDHFISHRTRGWLSLSYTPSTCTICGDATVGCGKFSLSVAEIRPDPFHIPLDALVRTVFVLAFISAAP